MIEIMFGTKARDFVIVSICMSKCISQMVIVPCICVLAPLLPCQVVQLLVPSDAPTHPSMFVLQVLTGIYLGLHKQPRVGCVCPP